MLFFLAVSWVDGAFSSFVLSNGFSAVCVYVHMCVHLHTMCLCRYRHKCVSFHCLWGLVALSV